MRDRDFLARIGVVRNSPSFRCRGDEELRNRADRLRETTHCRTSAGNWEHQVPKKTDPNQLLSLTVDNLSFNLYRAADQALYRAIWRVEIRWSWALARPANWAARGLSQNTLQGSSGIPISYGVSLRFFA
jgi:hypothetical protein